MTEVIHHVSTSWCKSSTSIHPLVVQCHLQWGTLLELFQLWIAQQAVIKNPEEKGYKNQTGQPNLKCRPPHYSYLLFRHSHLRVQLGDIAFSHARTTNKDNLLPSVTPRFLSLCLWDCIPLTFKSCVYMCPAISRGDSARSCPWHQDSLGKQGEKTWEIVGKQAINGSQKISLRQIWKFSWSGFKTDHHQSCGRTDSDLPAWDHSLTSVCCYQRSFVVVSFHLLCLTHHHLKHSPAVAMLLLEN